MIRNGRARRALASVVALLVAVRLLAAGGDTASAPVATPEAVYAAFTVNLTRFITWPDAALGAPGTPFVIGTFPRDPINAELDAAVAGEMVGSHPVRTMRLRSLNDLAKCNVVFFSRGVADPEAVVRSAQRRPILTVSDTDDFLTLGGHVRFVPQPPHTRLQISAPNLRSSGLEARAQLLRLASLP